MNTNNSRLLKRGWDQKLWGATRKGAAILFILALVVPAHAGPVVVNQVLQTLNPSQGTIDLRIKNISDAGSASSQDQKSSSGSRNGNGPDSGPKTDNLLSGVTISSDTPAIGVEEEAVVEGSVCDCGEIIIPGGAFPKWPFLFLAAVPLIFIHGSDDIPPPLSTPTPPPATPRGTPPPSTPEVPEPGSILLFGTGLLALGTGLRRRYLTTKGTDEDATKGDD